MCMQARAWFVMARTITDARWKAQERRPRMFTIGSGFEAQHECLQIAIQFIYLSSC